MLNKVELNAMSHCNKTTCCHSCIAYTLTPPKPYGFIRPTDCVEEAAKTALELIEKITELEAMLKRFEYVPDQFGGHCPLCGMGKGLGHMDNCELAKLLKGWC